MERYSMLLLNILYAVPIPKNQKWVTMVVDSQAKAEPTQPVKVRYSSKAKRLRQKRARAQDRNRRNQYTQMITSVFKRVLKKHGTHLKVWHIRSEDDRCLQAVDVISHFIYQRRRVDEEREELFQILLPGERSREQLAKNSKWQKLKNERSTWFESNEVIKPKIEWIRRPQYLHRRMIDKLARFSRRYQTQNRRGNREA